MHCAVNVDSSAYNSRASIDSALDRALALGEVAELYAHHPGVTVSLDEIEYVLAGARDRGLDFVTYHDFADPNTAPRAALALSFDDTSVDAWTDERPLFSQYGARITSSSLRSADRSSASRRWRSPATVTISKRTASIICGPDCVGRAGLRT
jgi:hypothetical protein